MAMGFRPVDRDQQFLLPPDMREWLPREHLVWFVIAVVDKLDLKEFVARARLGGVGRAGYDPRMLLTVLVYAYAVGVRSSRQIERLCHTDVAFRVACAQDIPDHTTIARFRQVHEDALTGLFDQVLGLCARSGLGRLGTIAIDGTKIAANASDGALRSEGWLRKEAERILSEAARADASEDALFGAGRGDELPEGLVDPVSRDGRILRVLAELEAEAARVEAERQVAREADRVKAAEYERRVTDPGVSVARRARVGRPPRDTDPVVVAQARLERELAAARAKVEDRDRREAVAAAAGKRLKGQRPVAVEDRARVVKARAALERARERRAEAAQGKPKEPDPVPAAEVRRNITDPDARSLPTRKGWVVGYNAQLVVSADQIILAADALQSPADSTAFIPMVEAVQVAAGVLAEAGSAHAEIGVVLADAGYRTVENLTAQGPDRLIATGKRRDDDRRATTEPASGPPPEDATVLEAMDHRLRTPEGRDLYRMRAPMSEGTNGQVKDVIGLRRFSRRGLKAVNSELSFASSVHNILKCYRHEREAA